MAPVEPDGFGTLLTGDKPGPSPEQEKLATMKMDEGAGERLRAEHDQAPSVHKQTEAERMDLTLLRGQLGNPFSFRHIPFSILRDMSTDLMLYFGYFFTITPQIRADWFIQCTDPQIAAAVDAAYRPIATTTTLQMAQSKWYGYQPMVKRFKLGQMDAVYRNPNSAEPDKDLPVWDSSADMLLWKPSAALNPSHCLPSWNDDGDMNGFRYSMVPIPHADLGVGLYGYNSFPGGQYVDPDFAMWRTNEAIENFGSVFGSARTKRAYPFWWSYWLRWALADRSFENLADPAKIVYYPTEFDEFVDPEDASATNPTIQKKRQQAIDLGQQMRSGATLAIPGDFATTSDGKATNMRKWQVSYLEGKNNFADLDATFAHLDVQKLRCVTADTPVECPRDHHRYPHGVPISDLKPGDLVWSFNTEKRLYELHPVKAAGCTRRQQPVFRVSLSNGSSIRATDNHPFLTTDLEWKMVRDLQPGDCLVEFKCDLEPTVKLDPSGSGRGSVLEYHTVAAQLGLESAKGKFDIHHIDGRHANTAPENLEQLSTSEHMSITRNGHRLSMASRVKISASHLKGKDAEHKRRIRNFHTADDQLLLERKEILAVATICSAEDCRDIVRARGVCNRHYQRARLDGIRLPLASDGANVQFRLKECDHCGREYAPTGSRQYQCQACRYEKGVEYNRTWRYRPGSDVIPEFCEMCDTVIVESIIEDGIEDVWDVAIDGPDECKNFVSRGVVLHNSWCLPEQALVEGRAGNSSRLVAAQMGEIYQEAQQLDADLDDSYVSENMFQQFIAANFPEKAGIPCKKVTRGLGALDSQLRSQVLTLIGQVRGDVLPVDTRELLSQLNIPLLSEQGMEAQIKQIAELQKLQGPPEVEPTKVGTQGYNAGVTRTENGNLAYYAGPERIILAESDGFMGSLPDTPHYRDAATRSAILRLRKMFMARYEHQYGSFADFLDDQATLQLAETNQSQQTKQDGLAQDAAAAAATAIVSAWAAEEAAGVAGAPAQSTSVAGSTAADLAGLISKIALAGGRSTLKSARLDAEGFDTDVIEPWVQERAAFALNSIDKTVRDEVQSFLTDALQSSVDPSKVAQEARDHFASFPTTHSERVVRAEARDAYNRGTLEALHLAGVSQVQAHDASDGSDKLTDSKCLARNGQIMSVQDAMAEEEHPRGTLWFSPLSTEKLSVQRVDQLPEHLTDMGQVAYEKDTETLYVLSDVSEEREKTYLLVLGDQLGL